MLVTQKIANLLNGVSQRPPTQRLPSQAAEQINALSSVARGVTTRPPARHVGLLTGVVTGWDTAFVHPIDRDTGERYHIVIANGQVFAFDALLATPVTVVSAGGQAYLTDAAGAGYRAVTIGDTTVIVNRGKTVKRGTKKTATLKFEAMVFVRQADFSTRYSIKLDGVEVAIRTVDQSTPDSRTSISTDAIASDLMAVLKAEAMLNSKFTFTQFGSTIYMVRQDSKDFAVSVTDGLADQGLKAVKGSVQSFEDLPARAPKDLIVQITGEAENVFDNYFVKYDDKGMPDKDGVWRECPAPGTLVNFDTTTLPHRLTRKGTLLKDVVNVGLPTQFAAITPLPASSSITSLSWALTTPGDVAIPANTTARLTDNNTGVKKTLTSGGPAFQVRYEIDVTKLEPGVVSWVRIYKNSVKVAEKSYRPGETKNRLYFAPTVESLRFLPEDPDVDLSAPASITDIQHVNTAVVNTDVIEVKLEYSTGVTPPSFRKAALTFQPSTLELYGTTAKRITLTGTFPAGSQVQIVLGADTFTYNVGAADVPATTVGAALATSIDAHANWITIANTPANVIDVKKSDNADFTATFPATLSDTTVFHNDTLTMVNAEHVGRTLKNLTDGCSGTITANGVTTITVAALTGGAENKFRPGDICTVIGTGTYFVFEPCPWNERISGDLIVNPFPSFTDGVINEVFFHQNRLGFTSGENVVLSSSGDLFNFFRYTATDLRADDVIDVKAASRLVTVFRNVFLWNSELHVWSDNAQFVLSGEPALTPTTVRLDLVGQHPNAADPRPVIVGERLFFTRGKSGHTQVFEFIGGENGLPSTAVDLTKDTPTYLDGAPKFMVGDAGEGFLALVTSANAQKNLFVYSFLYQGDNKVISSWSRWEFAVGMRLVGLDMVDGVLGLVHKNADGAFLSTIDLDLTPDPAEKVAYLDRRLSAASAAYSAGPNTTTWTLPYSIATDGSQGVVSVVNRTTKTVYVVTRPLATTVAVTGQGDLTAASVFIGLKYIYNYKFSTFYIRNDNGVPETRGRLQVKYIDLFYRDTTDFSVLVTPGGRPQITYVLALSSPGAGQKHVPILCENDQVVIEITNDKPGPCAISEVDWESFYTNRSKRL